MRDTAPPIKTTRRCHARGTTFRRRNPHHEKSNNPNMTMSSMRASPGDRSISAPKHPQFSAAPRDQASAAIKTKNAINTMPTGRPRRGFQSTKSAKPTAHSSGPNSKAQVAIRSQLSVSAKNWMCGIDCQKKSSGSHILVRPATKKTRPIIRWLAHKPFSSAFMAGDLRL